MTVSHRTPNRRAVTLVEVAVSTVLVGVVLVAALETVGGSLRTLRQTGSTLDGSALASAVLAEAMRLPYEDPDGDSVGIGRESDEPTNPTDRAAFDDFDDFEQVTFSPPVFTDGVAMPGYTGWTVLTRVYYVTAEPNGAGNLATTASDEGLKRIVVRVTDPSGTETKIDGFRSRHGAPEEPAPFAAERVSAIGVRVTVGSGDELFRGAHLTNLAEAP